MNITELCKPPSNPVQKNGFEKLGRSICMESPPSGTPTRVFLRACAINNREGARGNNPAWVRPHDRPQTAENQCFATFTLCKSETLRVYAHVRVGGYASESVGIRTTPPSTPIFYENCHSHTDSLLRPRLRLSVCGCDYCAPIIRAW